MKLSLLLPGWMLAFGLLAAQTAPVADRPAPASAGGTFRFAAGPSNGSSLALASVKNVLGPTMAVDNLQAKPPLAYYGLDSALLAKGAGLDAARLVGYHYLVVDNSGKAALAELSVDAAGATRDEVVVSYRSAPATQQIIDRLSQLALGQPLVSGSYEVRVIGLYGPTSVLWFKSDQPDADLIYTYDPVGLYRGLQRDTVYPAKDFLTAIRPTLQARIDEDLATQAQIAARAHAQPRPARSITEWTSEGQLHNYFASGFASNSLSSHSLAFDDSMLLVPGASAGLANTTAGPTQIYKFERRPDLIGIAHHNPPVIFNGLGGGLIKAGRSISQSYPIGTRSLTDFETKALDELRAGQDTVSQPTDDGGRLMVGAIRAQSNCLQCHNVAKAGELLGAISYRLSQTSPPPAGVKVNLNVTDAQLQRTNQLRAETEIVFATSDEEAAAPAHPDTSRDRLLALQAVLQKNLAMLQQVSPAPTDGSVEAAAACFKQALAELDAGLAFIGADPEADALPFDPAPVALPSLVMIANITTARNAFPELFAAQESLAIGLRNFLIGGNSPLPANYASPRASGPVIGAMGGARDRIMLRVFAARASLSRITRPSPDPSPAAEPRAAATAVIPVLADGDKPGSISGLVVDTNGDPAANVLISIGVRRSEAELRAAAVIRYTPTPPDAPPGAGFQAAVDKMTPERREAAIAAAAKGVVYAAVVPVTLSDGRGKFTIPNLPPGDYRITGDLIATSGGWRLAASLQPVTVEAGSEIRLNDPLKLK